MGLKVSKKLKFDNKIIDRRKSVTDDFVTFYESLPKLREFASFQIAFTLWSNIIHDEELIDMRSIWLDHTEGENWTYQFIASYRKKLYKSLHHLHIDDNAIETRVKKSIEIVLKETAEWLRYHKLDILSNTLSDYGFHHLYPKCCVWLPHGRRIDYEKSARNMLSGSELSEEQKFAVMCKYCFVDEIEDLSINWISRNFVDKVTIDDDPLIYYWICHKTNTTMDLSLKGRYMVRRFGVDNPSALDYFWDHFSHNHQLSIAIDLLRQRCFERCHMHVLTKLNGNQLRNVLTQIPTKVIITTWEHSSLDNAFDIWAEAKDLMSNKDFSLLVNTILFNYTCIEDEAKVLLLGIWNTAPNHLRQYIADFKTYHIIRSKLDSRDLITGSELQFLSKLLLNTSSEFRKSFVKEKRDSLVTCNFRQADEIIRLFLSTEDEVLEYKKSLLIESQDVKNRCTQIFHEHENIDELDKFLDFFTDQTPLKHEYKKQLLRSGQLTRDYFIFETTLWKKLVHFVDTLYPEPTAASEQKSNLVFSFLEHDSYSWHGEFLRQIDAVVAAHLSADDILDFKRQLLTRWKKDVEAGRYKRWSEPEHIREFVSWCLPEHYRVSEFKRDLSIDRIFAVTLESIVKDSENEFASFENFLQWYFDDPRKVREYKLQKAFNHQRIEIIEKLLKDENDYVLRAMMSWFFDGNHELIAEFASKMLVCPRLSSKNRNTSHSRVRTT